MAPKRSTVVALAAAALGLGTLSSPARAQTTRTVYISASDSRGGHVGDLTADDVVVKDGGRTREIAGLRPATARMDIAILVDDNGSGAYQAGVLQFLQTLVGYARFSITELMPQAVKLLDYTDNVEAIQAALNQLGPRGRVQGDGEQLTEAIIRAGEDLRKRGAARPVILALTISGGAGARNQDISMNRLGDSGALLNTVFVAGTRLGLVIADGPGQSGGRAEQVGTDLGIPPAITNIAGMLLHQYALTYVLPDGVKASGRLSVSSRRKGTSIRAPTRVPEHEDRGAPDALSPASAAARLP